MGGTAPGGGGGKTTSVHFGRGGGLPRSRCLRLRLALALAVALALGVLSPLWPCGLTIPATGGCLHTHSLIGLRPLAPWWRGAAAGLPRAGGFFWASASEPLAC